MGDFKDEQNQRQAEFEAYKHRSSYESAQISAGNRKLMEDVSRGSSTYSNNNPAPKKDPYASSFSDPFATNNTPAPPPREWTEEEKQAAAEGLEMLAKGVLCVLAAPFFVTHWALEQVTGEEKPIVAGFCTAGFWLAVVGFSNMDHHPKTQSAPLAAAAVSEPAPASRKSYIAYDGGPLTMQSTTGKIATINMDKGTCLELAVKDGKEGYSLVRMEGFGVTAQGWASNADLHPSPQCR